MKPKNVFYIHVFSFSKIQIINKKITITTNIFKYIVHKTCITYYTTSLVLNIIGKIKSNLFLNSFSLLNTVLQVNISILYSVVLLFLKYQ